MKRRLELLGYGLMILLALARYAGGPETASRSEHGRRPPAGDPDPDMIEIEVGPKPRLSLGTAFLVSEHGLWATAAHVSDFCDSIEIRTGRDAALPAIAAHPVKGRDLAILRSEPIAAEPLRLLGAPMRRGSPGRHLGFPGGRAGEVATRYLGATRMRRTGVSDAVERVDVWAEIARMPDGLPGLGGISGGPVLDAGGRVRGINSAATVRRGRLYTVPAEALIEAAEAAFPNALPHERPPTRIDEPGHERRAPAVIRPVFCHVGP